MKEKKGSVFGGSLLLIGSCVGAGMLALPILTGSLGFFPSLSLFLVVYSFVVCTSFLLVEVVGWYEKPVNLISMVGALLGKSGKVLCWFLYLFLFYALLVAYITLSGEHTSHLLHQLHLASLPSYVGSLFFVLLFGVLVYLGTRPVDYLNRYLMLGKIIAYLIVIGCSISFLSPEFLLFFKGTRFIQAIPVLVAAFGFQNMVPSLMKYMGGDRKRVRLAILLGASLTLVLYVAWQLIVLGILPREVIAKSFAEGQDAAIALSLFVQSPWIGISAQMLAFFAILTSFLAQSLSLLHFLQDGLKMEGQGKEHLTVCFLTLFPPLVIAMGFPHLFFSALGFAGGICAVSLFGILPVCMVWKGRYSKRYMLVDRVRGGKGMLCSLFLFSCFIFFYQLASMLEITLPGMQKT